MIDLLDTVDPAAPSLPERLPLDFRPRRRPRSPRTARSLRPLAATTCGCSCLARRSPAAPRPRSPICPTCSRRRPPRRQHVGHRPRRDRRSLPTGGRGSSCTSRPSCPAGCGWSSRAAASPTGSTAPLQLPTAAGATARSPTARRSSTCSARPPGSSRLWLAVTADGVDRGRRTLAGHGRPIRYRHVPRDWPLDAYQTVFADRAGERRDAERGRPFTAELVTDLVGRGVVDRADPAAHRRVVARRRRAAVPRALPRATRPPPRSSTRCTAPAGASSPSAPPWCARSRPSPTTTASCTRARAGPTSSSRRDAACARSTACSPAGTSPRRPTC